jgi:hypothetical protein
MVRFVRIEMLKHYLKEGWTVLVQGTEMAAVRKDYGTTNDDVWTQE